jgi:hypothetical protein
MRLTVPNTSLAVTFSLTIVLIIDFPVFVKHFLVLFGHIDLPLSRRLPPP